MKKSKINRWPTYSLLGAFVSTIAIFAVYTYVYAKKHPDLYLAKSQHVVAAVGDSQDLTASDPWPIIYPGTKGMVIQNVPVQASIAKTWPERIQGLSGTPYLPEMVVKLFVFDTPGLHSIWMKDMNYAIDIVWVDETGTIVDVAENATPESYPDTFFEPKRDALYVIETVAGFVKKHGIRTGDTVILPVW